MRRIIVSLGALMLVLSGLAGASAQQARADLPFYDIIVVGGEQAISAEVFAALEASTTGSVVRVSGSNRFSTAAAVSEIAAQPGAQVVFVATGENFPDALVAGPVAAREGGSVVLVERDRVPDPTRLELERLQPQTVVALGGSEAISQRVLDELGDITGAPVERVSGPTRFSTAAALSRVSYSPGVPMVYIATGLNFADALTGGPAGAVRGAPILLTGTTALPPSTRAELERLRPGGIGILGGRAAVSEQVEAELEAYTSGPVERIGGAGREATAAKISEHAFPAGAGIVFIATGANFPDALAIGAAAGAEPHNRFGLLGSGSGFAGETPGPVLLTRPNSLPGETVAELVRLGRALPALDAHDQQVETDFETPVDITLEADGPGAAPLTFEVTSPPQHGTLSGDAPELTYTPGVGFTGTDSFAFTASLGSATSDAATVEITVRPPAVPIAHGQSVTTAFETPVGITLTGSAPSGLPLTFAVASGPGDGTLSGTPPNVTYTPDAGFEGTDSFTFTVSDGIATSAPATVEVFVEPEPPAAADVAATTAQEDPVVVTLDGASPSGQPLTYHYAQPADGTVTGAGPGVTYTPDAGFHGTDTFTYHVNDGFNDSNTATVTVTVEPLPPVAHDQQVDASKDTSVVITLGADSPSGGPLTYHYAQPSDGTVTGTGPDVTYTPDPGFEGTDAFTFHVNDGFNDSNTATVTVEVEPAAPVAHDVSETTDQDTPVAVTLAADNFSANPLTYHYDQPSDGTVTGTGPDVTYTPDPGFHGTDTFTYHVNDGFNDSNTATVTVTVHPAEPVAEDQAVSTPFETAVLITLGAQSPSGGPLTFHYAQPSDGTVTGTGPDVTYTPDPGFHGTDSFTFHVNDTFNDSNTATVTVTVEPAAPVAHDVSETTDQDTPVVITLVADNFSANPLTYHYAQPSDGTVTGAGPDVTYTPDPGFFGTDTFTYHVNDGFNDSNTATVTVTVEPLPPVAHDVSADTPFETAVVITLDGQSLSGEPLTYVVVDQPDNGTAVLVGDGPDVTYTPDPGFEADDDTFTYRVNDGFNDSNTATVTVSVEPAPPTAADVDAETDEDTPVVITLDANSPSGQALTYHYAQPSDGTVTGSGPDVTYTPDPGFFGTDTFTYHVNDGFNDSNTATVTVTVNFNAEDYDFDAVGNTLLEVGVAASGDPAVVVSASLLDDAPSPDFEVEAVDDSGASGDVDWDTDGTFTYEPAAGFTGDDTFTYTIGDGTFSGSGTVTVTVADTVWYVDGAASGDGRSWQPFETLAEAEAASGEGDTIFVYEGTYTDGIELQDDQELLGEEAGLSLGGHDLVDPGDRPAIDAGGDDAIVLASGASVQGIDVTGGLRGIVAEGAGGTMTVTDVDVSGTTSHAVNLAGAGDVALTGVDVTNSGGNAIFLHGLTGTVSHDGTITQSGATAAVAVVDTVLGSDASLGPVTSAASGISVSTSAGDVEIASATLGSPGTRVSGAGLAVSASGGVTVGSLTAYTQGGAAVSADSASSVTIEGGSADTQGAPVLSMNNSGADIELATGTSSGSAGHGLSLSGVTGSVQIDGGSITGATGTGVLVSGGSVDLTAGVSVTNATGNSVNVGGLSSGSVALSGAITDTGSGIALATNTGSTIAFTGVLAITTNGSTAFAATGGGTVTATASGSTLAATGARGLQVSSTTIGAAGLHFDSISASGSVHGIEVSSAGSGPLVVAGDGSGNRNGSGGVISGMSSHGVNLVNAGGVTLRNMTVEDNGAVGVRAQGLTGLTLVAAHLAGNTTDQANPATRNSVWLRQVTGQVRIADSFVTGSVHNQVDIENSSGSVTIEVERTTLDDNGINSGLQVEAVGSASVTLDVSDSTFTDHHATGVHAFARNTATLTVTVEDSTLTGNNVAVNLAAQHTATLTSTVTGNTISGHASHSINATVHEDATHNTTITGNTLNTTATAASVGIRLVAEDDSLMRGRVEGNTVSGQTSGHGIRVLARDDAGRVHLTLLDNHVATTSDSPAYLIEPLQQSYLCAVISGNTGSSNHTTRDLTVDLFDAGASGDFEGAAVGPLTQAQLEAHLSAQNPGPRVGAFVDANAFGVAAGTCQQP